VAESPKVCCIVLNWNRRNDLLACLASLQKSTYSNMEVVVVDNASRDGSVEAVEEQFPDAKLIVNAENLRWAEGNNVGLRYALAHGAGYILLLNNDIEVDADMVSRLIEAAEETPQIGLLAPKIYYHAQPDLIWYAGGEIRWWHGLIRHTGIRQKDIGQFEDLIETDYITGCAMLIRREVADDIGEIDAAYYLYGEDVDYSVRAARAGWRLVINPQATMWHKVSASTGVVSWQKMRLKLRSQLTLYRKYAPPWAWVTTIPLFFLLDSLRAAILLVTGRLVKPVKGPS